MQSDDKLQRIVDQLEKWIAEECPHQDLLDQHQALLLLRGKLARSIGTLRNGSGLPREKRIELLRPIMDWYADNESLFPPQVVSSLNVVTETVNCCVDDHTLRQIQQPDAWSFFNFHWRVVMEYHVLVRGRLATLERDQRAQSTAVGNGEAVVPAPATDSTSTNPEGDEEWSFAHSEDYRSVNLNGQAFELTPNQAQVVQKLHEAHVNRTPVLSDAHLLESLQVKSDRLRDVFKGSPAWGTLVVQGKSRGTRRLGP